MLVVKNIRILLLKHFACLSGAGPLTFKDLEIVSYAWLIYFIFSIIIAEKDAVQWYFKVDILQVA